jgi:hypothetical protein
MFVGAGEKTYQGMIIGENSRSDDLDVNPMKAKQLTNVRASGKDEAIRLTPPRRLTLEQAIAYIDDDELVEVTPKAIRLRKQVLNPSFRKKRVKEDAYATLPGRGGTATPAKPGEQGGVVGRCRAPTGWRRRPATHNPTLAALRASLPSPVGEGRQALRTPAAG